MSDIESTLLAKVHKNTKALLIWIPIIAILGSGLISWGIGIEKQSSLDARVTKIEVDKVNKEVLEGMKESIDFKFQILFKHFNIVVDTTKHK